MSKVYAHYGSRRFDPTKFVDVLNHPDSMCDGRKPRYGLWGSDVTSRFGWDSVILSDPEVAKKERWRLLESFQFRLSDSARLLRIESLEGFV